MNCECGGKGEYFQAGPEGEGFYCARCAPSQGKKCCKCGRDIPLYDNFFKNGLWYCPSCEPDEDWLGESYTVLSGPAAQRILRQIEETSDGITYEVADFPELGVLIQDLRIADVYGRRKDSKWILVWRNI